MALPPNRNQQKGTGFTNINRVLQSNQGNKLGSTVSSGVAGQAQNVRQETQNAQQDFQQEANKNRLDTDEAKQKREGIIGRFNESNYAPNMANFQVSSGLQNQYQTAKQKYEQDKAAQQQTLTTAQQQAQQTNQQLSEAQNNYNTLANKWGDYLRAGDYTSAYSNGTFNLSPSQESERTRTELEAAKKRLDELQASSSGLMDAEKQANEKFASTGNILTNLEKQYQDQTKAEEEAYRRSETERLMAANMPTEQEIKEFTKYRTGTYTGPRELKDYQTLLGQAAEGEQLGDLTRSTGGRQELLRRFVGGTDYTQGQQRLDNLLLGQQGTTDLNQARKSTRGLENVVSGANEQAGNLAQEYVNRAKIFGEETVGKLNEARNPISSKVDEQLKKLQEEESGRLNNVKYLQDVLSGSDANYKNLDRMTRLGLGLQGALDAGFLNQNQANALLGDQGLIARAEALGLDTNSLINERLKSTSAKNLNRGGAANAVQESQLTALDKLLGKQNTDIEFNQAGADYEKGGVGFDFDSLNDYISKTEKMKYANDAKKLAELEAYNARYMNQALGNLQGAAGSTIQSLGTGLNQLTNPQAYVDPSKMLNNVTDGITGVGNAGIQTANAGFQASNGILEGLTKLNIGGQSLANTEGGRQLLKAIELKSKLENEAAAAGGSLLGNVAKGTQQLVKGDLSGLVGITGLQDIGNKLGLNLTNELSKIGGSFTNPGSLTKSVGKKLKKMFSDEKLKDNVKPADSKIEQLLEKLNAHEYEYKPEVGEPGKHISVMAQELEKSDLGEEAVEDHEMGKMVDYEKLAPVQLAALSSLHKRIKKLENK